MIDRQIDSLLHESEITLRLQYFRIFLKLALCTVKPSRSHQKVDIISKKNIMSLQCPVHPQDSRSSGHGRVGQGRTEGW